jgi:hypothetical protein
MTYLGIICGKSKLSVDCTAERHAFPQDNRGKEVFIEKKVLQKL